MSKYTFQTIDILSFFILSLLLPIDYLFFNTCIIISIIFFYPIYTIIHINTCAILNRFPLKYTHYNKCMIFICILIIVTMISSLFALFYLRFIPSSVRPLASPLPALAYSHCICKVIGSIKTRKKKSQSSCGESIV